MTARSAWVLNLDADVELASPDAHTPSARTAKHMKEWSGALASLIGEADVVLEGDDVVTSPKFTGRAWCPTPRALRRLEKAGAMPLPAPEFAVLRQVNHRRFAAELGQTLPGAHFVTTMDDLRRAIAGESASGHWLLKRPFGFAGRGRRRVAAGALDPSAVSWVVASLRAGDGLQVEPWVERVADYGLHGFLSEAGDVTFGEPTRQICDDTGAWKGSALATDLAPREAITLRASAERVARALCTARYFGPFGVDAYRWKNGATVSFNELGEINARYSMGWATGMQRCRVDLF